MIFVNAISIVIEIARITVKMVCKMTFDDNYRFWRILKSYFLRKTHQSLFYLLKVLVNLKIKIFRIGVFKVPEYTYNNCKLYTEQKNKVSTQFTFQFILILMKIKDVKCYQFSNHFFKSLHAPQSIDVVRLWSVKLQRGQIQMSQLNIPYSFCGDFFSDRL